MLADLEEGNVSVGVVSAEVGKMLGVLRLSSSEGMSLATSEAARLSEPANREKLKYTGGTYYLSIRSSATFGRLGEPKIPG